MKRAVGYVKKNADVHPTRSHLVNGNPPVVTPEAVRWVKPTRGPGLEHAKN
jgi:hypothetical protein